MHSWTALRAVGCYVYRLAAINVEALDARSRRVAQANRIGSLHKRALVAAFNECEPTWSAEQKICRAGATALAGIGAGEENEARFVETGCYRDWIGAVGGVHVIREADRRK